MLSFSHLSRPIQKKKKKKSCQVISYERTSSDSRRSSVSSTWTTASAPQGIGAPVVTLITWPGITVWVGCTHTHTHWHAHTQLLHSACCQVLLGQCNTSNISYTSPLVTIFHFNNSPPDCVYSQTNLTYSWQCECNGADLLSSLWLSHDEAISRAVSSYRLMTRIRNTEYCTDNLACSSSKH